MSILCRPLKHKKNTVNTFVAGHKAETIFQSTTTRSILPFRLISAIRRGVADQITELAVTAIHTSVYTWKPSPRISEKHHIQIWASYYWFESTNLSAHDWTKVAVQNHLHFASKSSNNHVNSSSATSGRQTLSFNGPIVLPLRWRMVGTGGFRNLARHRTISLIIISRSTHSVTQLATALLSITEEVVMPMRHLHLLAPRFRKLPLTTHIPCTVKGINRANT